MGYENSPNVVEAGKAHEVKAAAAKLAEAEVDAKYEQLLKKNFIVRFVYWVLSFVVPGLGMFSEAYFIFSVGNLKTLWGAAYPECWKTHQTCSSKLTDTITYTQVSGIIAGQLFIGLFADKLGRKLGSVMTASIMFIFAILITASSGSDSGKLFTMFTVVQFFFGVGVGGEYPVASTSANERAENSKHLQARRGETVVLVFSMQGWGNAVNTLVLVILCAAFNQYNPPYSKHRLEIIWRLSYGLGIIPLAFMLFWRIFFLKESAVWRGKKQSLHDLGDAGRKHWHRNWLLLRHYWHRVAGTALSWFVWDFAFYGNKLFQSTFIGIIKPEAKGNIIVGLEWTLLNSAVALVGYYFAAFTIDKPWMGRKRMQSMGFLWMGVLFIICAADYHHLIKGGIHWFQFLYFFSSFWGQFGPNATTWLLPAEIIPTEMRSMCHGFAAAVGKAGALVAGVVFGKVNDQTKFWISAACGFAGVVCTVILIPDLTGLDLREGDKRWLAIVDGVEHEYTGPALAPKHLSLFERILGYSKNYKGSNDYNDDGSGSSTPPKVAADEVEPAPLKV